MSSYWRIDQVIISNNVPAPTIGINAIASISIGVAKSVILYEQKLLAPEVRSIRPRSIAMGVASPIIMAYLKRERPSHLIKDTVIYNAVNLTARHDKRIGIQLIKVAVVDSR